MLSLPIRLHLPFILFIPICLLLPLSPFFLFHALCLSLLFSFCLSFPLWMQLYVPMHHNQTGLLIHVAPGYHFIFLLLFFLWSCLGMTCPRQRSAVPPSLYFHTPLPEDTMMHMHTHIIFFPPHKAAPVCEFVLSRRWFLWYVNMESCQSISHFFMVISLQPYLLLLYKWYGRPVSAVSRRIGNTVFNMPSCHIPVNMRFG